MKKLYSITLMCFILVVSACNGDETIIVTPTTGTLIVKPRVEGTTTFLANVKVKLALNLDDLINDRYIMEVFSDVNGNADFGKLNPQNYFFEAYTEVGGDDYYGDGNIQIIAGEDFVFILEM